ncbi:MAG: hypothetical protein J6S14_02255 [Clostridia bacterium]|nr:hypothetical protein [Clostridia bacterium]
MLPTKVTICGIPHKVMLVDDNFDIDCHLGQINYAECKIRINKNAAEPMQKQALVHEIVHGMLVMTGFSEVSTDETFVQALAMAINQTFDIKGAK